MFLSDYEDEIVCLDSSPEKSPKVVNLKYNQISINDSGILDEIAVEVDSEDEIEVDGGVQNKSVITLDDNAFDNLKSTIEDEEIISKSELGGNTIRRCFVGLYNSPVVFEDDLDASDSESDICKPGQKKLVRQKITQSGKQEETLSQRRSTRGRKKSIVEVNIEDSDDEGYESPRAAKKKSNRQKEDDKDASENVVEMSDYEKIRDNNIKERMEMLKALGIKSALDDCKSGLGLKKTAEKRQRTGETFSGERRKSARLAARDEDEDYVPNYRAEASEDKYALDNPSDHSHDGIRRHPCRECSNCLVPDCRKCVYCRDKKRYGGRNILKQKCAYKPKCSNPIVLCNICNGSRSFSCGICDEKFPESYLLDQHKEEAHKIEKEKRRSSRLSEQKFSVKYAGSEDEGKDSE